MNLYNNKATKLLFKTNKTNKKTDFRTKYIQHFYVKIIL